MVMDMSLTELEWHTYISPPRHTSTHTAAL